MELTITATTTCYSIKKGTQNYGSVTVNSDGSKTFLPAVTVTYTLSQLQEIVTFMTGL